MMNALDTLQATPVPQSQPLPGTGQVPNHAGGFVWQVDDWNRLDRFLILGSEGATYYSSAQTLTLENAQAVINCISTDGPRVVARVVAISVAGRAPKNEPALFALALCAGLGDDHTRRTAFAALPQVARIGTHLFHFLAYARLIRGWGRGLRRAVADWYNTLAVERLVYQVIKYQQRDGWSHRDALRLAHPQSTDAQRNAIYHWVTQGWPSVGETPHPDPVLRRLWAVEQAKIATDEATIVRLIKAYDLPWEVIPTHWLASATVWHALLPALPLTALLRNLGRLTANGLLGAPATPPEAHRQQATKALTTLGMALVRWREGQQPATAQMATALVRQRAALKFVVKRLTDPQRLRQARVHPIAVLAALQTYSSGGGARGKLTWAAEPAIVDALNRAFYLAFGNVEATGKRVLLALDVSGSMETGMIAGVPGLTPRVASAALALITAATEPHHTIVAFTAAQDGAGGQWGGGTPGLTPVPIGPQDQLETVVQQVRALPMGGTDCALPMIWAQQQRIAVDTFVVYTDNETWHGAVHPAQALRDYRRHTGIAAKLVVVGMVANGFTLADPTDGGMLDVVGFDTATPQLIADFMAT